jgi:UDP-N-acetylmuramoyl-tripeptide--D-alanyl-D-alanine ligase
MATAALRKDGEEMTRLYAWIVSVSVLSAVLLPIAENFRDEPQDSFPLSYYPMFSKPRRADLRITHCIGIDRNGDRHLIPYRACGSGGMNQVRKQIRKIANSGPKKARSLCRRVARRLEREKKGFEQVQLVTSKYAVDDYFAGRVTQPKSQRVHAVYPRLSPIGKDEFRPWLHRHVANLDWRSSVRDRQIDEATLGESLRLGTQFLVENQTPLGRFDYQYDFVSRKLDSSDNQVRQAGALWGLALLHLDRPTLATQEAIRRGLDFFLANTRREEDMAYIVYPGSSVCKTGTVALVALSVIDFLRTEPLERSPEGEVWRTTLRQHLNEYLAFLEFMRLKDRRFARSYRWSHSTRDRKHSPYYDGEALLCMTKAARYHGHDHLVPLIEQSAVVMAKTYTADAWRRDPDSDLTKGFFQWGCMALCEYHQSGWEEADLMADCVLALSWWMIHTHDTLDRTRNTAYAHEGLIQGYLVAEQRGNKLAACFLAQAIDAGLSKLTAWQVGGPLCETNEFLSRYPTNDPRAVGGVMNHRARPALRIDVAQHQMHAVALALKHLYCDPRDIKIGS